MFCGECGKAIPDGGRFCPRCGWSTTAATQPAVPRPEVVSVPVSPKSTPEIPQQADIDTRRIELEKSVPSQVDTSIPISSDQSNHNGKIVSLLVGGGVLLASLLWYSTLRTPSKSPVSAVGNVKAKAIAPTTNTIPVVEQHSEDSVPSQAAVPANTPPEVPAVPETEPADRILLNSTLTVPANSYKYVGFMSPDSEGNVRINGHFEARGGAGNDIQVLLLDEDGFANWKNRHPARAFYNSGKVTAGTLDVMIAPSVYYYLVVNNQFSIMTPKAVSAEIALHFRRKV